jgi:hypothetical protein
MMWALAKYLLIAYATTSIAFAFFLYIRTKNFDLIVSLLASENSCHKLLSREQALLLKVVRLSRLALIICMSVLIFAEFVQLARVA